MNAAGLSAFRGRIQATMEALFPATLIVGNTLAELHASTGGLTNGRDLGSGGFLPEYEIAFRVRKELLAAPEVGARIVWVERMLTFRIMRVRDGGGDPAWHLGCEAVDKR